MPTCPNCNEVNPDRARFCLACGSPLPEVSAAPVESRRVVTVVFADMVGSTALGEKTDPETMRRVMARYYDEVKLVLEAHGGTVEKFIGDAVMAVFGVPQLHEDDALRAVRAAWEMRESLERLNEELAQRWNVTLAVRTGVNTGEVMAGDPGSGQSLVVGDAVNVAARLEQTATAGEILLGAGTYRLVRDAVTAEEVTGMTVKGKAEALTAYRLVDLDRSAAGVARRTDAPLVGRQNELDLLERALERTRRERNCHLFTVLGTAGVGKSRLVDEFLSRHPEARVLAGRCLPYGEGITFWPVAELIGEAFGLSEDDDSVAALEKLRSALIEEPQGELIARRLATMIGLLDEAAPAEEMFWAARRVIEDIARREQLVVVFDDIHWGEPTFLDLIQHFGEWTRNAPVLLIVMARPELLDVRRGWGGGLMNATSILLEPLGPEESRSIVQRVAGGVDVPDDVADQLIEAAGGNPLFVEEMIATLIEEGALQRSGDRWSWTARADSIVIPPTIQALLAARLDHLALDERRALEYASVIGKVFWSDAVTYLAAGESPVEPQLMRLVRKDLIRPVEGDQETFTFRHILIRDAAYGAMAKQTRASLHERFATWLEEAVGDREREYEEIIAYHLESAYLYRRDLGASEREQAEVAREAASRFRTAARRAYNRYDVCGTLNLLERALALMPGEDPGRFDALLDAFDARLEIGEIDDATATMKELEVLVGDDPIKGAVARLCRVNLSAYVATEPLTYQRDEVERVIAVLEGAGDDRLLSRAWFSLAAVENARCRGERMLIAIRRARECALRSGDGKTAIDSFLWWMASLGLGPTPASECVRIMEIVKPEADSNITRGAMDNLRAHVLGMQGKTDEAVASFEQVQNELLELGAQILARGSAMHAAWSLAYADRWEEAEVFLRDTHDALLKLGETGYRSTMATELSKVLYYLGRYDEAAEFTAIGRDIGAEDDIATQAGWRRTDAKLAARRGDFDEAMRLVGEVKALIADIDYLNMIGEAYVDIAEVYEMAARPDEARSAYEHALASFSEKENELMVAKVSSRLRQLVASLE